jgi:hypothetical protein
MTSLIFSGLNGSQSLLDFSLDFLFRKDRLGQDFHEEIESLVQIFLQNLEVVG